MRHQAPGTAQRRHGRVRTTERSVDAGAVDGKRRRQTLDACPPPPSPQSATARRRDGAHDADPLPLLLPAVRHERDRRRPPGDPRAGRLPDQQGRPVLQGLVVHRAARPPRAAAPPAGPRDARRPHQPAGRDHLGRRPRPAGRRDRAHPGALRPRRRRLLRRRVADQRAGLPVRQVRPRRAAHQRHRLQRPVLHVLGRGRGQPGVRARPGHAVPAERHRRGRRRRPGRQQPGRHHAAGDAVLRRRARAAARSTSSSTPGAPPPPATPPCTCSRCPAPTWRWPTGCCTSRWPRGWSTRTYVAARTTGFEAVRAGRRRATGRTGSSGSPASRSPTSGAPSSPWPARRRRSSSPPAAPSSTAAAPTPPRRGSTSRSPSACPAARAAAGAPSPARATGRAAASTGRRPTSCPATGRWRTRPPARTSPRSGGSTPTTCRCPGGRRSSCSTRSAPTAASARCSSWRRNVAVSAPDARRVISRLGDLDFLAVSDFFLSETAELADVVLPSAMWAEEDGTMTNLEGRVIRRRQALDPPTGVPDDLQLLATLAERLGAGRQVQRRPRDGLRGAAPGQRRGSGRLLRHQLPPDRRRAGRLLAVPGRRATPARRGCSPSGSPPPTAGRGSCASSTSTPTSGPTPTTRTCSPPAG